MKYLVFCLKHKDMFISQDTLEDLANIRENYVNEMKTACLRLNMNDSEDIYFQCTDYQFYLACL